MPAALVRDIPDGGWGQRAGETEASGDRHLTTTALYTRVDVRGLAAMTRFAGATHERGGYNSASHFDGAQARVRAHHARPRGARAQGLHRRYPDCGRGHRGAAQGGGYRPDEMLEHYMRPLTLAQVHSALAYYYDQREEVEAYFDESHQAVAELEAERAEYLSRHPVA